MALARRSTRNVSGTIWPGFVDAMTALLLVLMFVLTIFMVVQYVLREQISGQATELDALSLQVSDLADALSKFNANFLSDLPAAAAERFKIDQPDGLLQDFIARQEAWKERLAKVDIQDQDAILGLLDEFIFSKIDVDSYGMAD